MNAELKEFAKREYPDTKSDLFAMFIERGFEMAKEGIGYNAMVTMQSWMFLSSYEKMREKMFDISAIRNMVYMSNGVMGIAFGTNATVWFNKKLPKYKGSFSSVDNSDLMENNIPKKFPVKNNRLKDASADDFKKIPGSPIAYWVSEKERKLYSSGELLGAITYPKKGLDTGQNERFLRLWYEISIKYACFDVADFGKKWFPYNKGGDFRRWYGNREYVINWENEGQEIKSLLTQETKKPTIRNVGFHFREGFTWTTVSAGGFSARYCPKGALFDNGGCTLFADSKLNIFGGFLNSTVLDRFLEFLAPTLNFQPGDIAKALFPQKICMLNLNLSTSECIRLSKNDWDSYETSWEFNNLPILQLKEKTLSDAYQNYLSQCQQMTAQTKQLEEENNRIFIEAYGLQDELTPDVPIEEITLFANPHYRYKGNLSDEDLESRFKSDTMKELISYAVCCMLGRYSLDTPGLIYAHSNNEGFDASKYKIFPADNDGIIPITGREWFDDDTPCRFFKFIETSWDKKELDNNLDFIAEAIGSKSSESSRETIRKYFVNDFFKDHCQTYKKRPIYWLFSSGKEKAFQVLVYLHRYNEGTLSRMRIEYVLPLQTKINRHLEHLVKDKETASTSSAGKLQKEISLLLKQKDELIKFDELLRHYADMKIKLDLDDGVKVNYNKFGELLSDVKKIVGSEKNEQEDENE